MNEENIKERLSLIFAITRVCDIICERNNKNFDELLKQKQPDFNNEELINYIKEQIKAYNVDFEAYESTIKKIISSKAYMELDKLYNDFTYYSEDFASDLNLDTEYIEELERLKANLTKKGITHLNKIIENHKEFIFLLAENSKLILEDKEQIADIIRENYINIFDNYIKEKAETQKILLKGQAELIKKFCADNIHIPSTPEEKNKITLDFLHLPYNEALKFINFITFKSKENKLLKLIDEFLQTSVLKTYQGKLIELEAVADYTKRTSETVKNLLDKFKNLLEELKDKQSDFYKFNETIKILQSEVLKNYKLTKQDKPLDSIEEVEVYFKNGNWITTNSSVIIEEKGANLYTRIENIRSHTPLTFNNSFERQVKLHEIKSYKNEMKIKAIKYLIQEKINDLNANYDSETNILILSEEELERATDLQETRNAQEILNNLMNLIENTKSDYLEVNEKKAILTSFNYFKIIKIEMYNNKIINYHLSLHPYFKDYFFKNKMQFLTGLTHLTAEQRVIEHRIGQIKNTDIENNKELTIIDESEVFKGIISYNVASKTNEHIDKKKKHKAIKDYSNISVIYDLTDINNGQWEVRNKRQQAQPVEIPEEQREIKPLNKTEAKKFIKELYPDIENKNSEAIYKLLESENKLTLPPFHLKNEISKYYKIILESANHKPQPKPRQRKQTRTREDFINISKVNNINVKYALKCYAYMESKQNLKLSDSEILTNIKKFIESKYLQMKQFSNENNFDFEAVVKIISDIYKKQINELTDKEFIEAQNRVKLYMQKQELIRLEEEKLQAEFNELTPEEREAKLKTIKNIFNN